MTQQTVDVTRAQICSREVGLAVWWTQPRGSYLNCTLTKLQCTTLQCTALYCTVLYSDVLYWSAVQCTARGAPRSGWGSAGGEAERAAAGSHSCSGSFTYNYSPN